MKTAIPVFLEDDTIEHLEWIAGKLKQQRGVNVSMSETIEYVTRQHWKRLHRKRAQKLHDRKLERSGMSV